MTTAPDAAAAAPALLTRREALRRAALFLGAALSPSVLEGALQAATLPAGDGSLPRWLDRRQFETVSAAVERILPKTDTPGALDVGVPAFIDLIYGKYLSGDERFVFATGLKEVEALARSRAGKAFSQLAAADQDSVLRTIAEASQKREKTFFHLLKELTVTGYFTSETVGKTVLHYDPVPGRWDACIPISDVGRRNWTK